MWLDSTNNKIDMPGSDYSERWNEARDGEDPNDFLDELLEDEVDKDIEKELRDTVNRLQNKIEELKDG